MSSNRKRYSFGGLDHPGMVRAITFYANPDNPNYAKDDEHASNYSARDRQIYMERQKLVHRNGPMWWKCNKQQLAKLNSL